LSNNSKFFEFFAKVKLHGIFVKVLRVSTCNFCI